VTDGTPSRVNPLTARERAASRRRGQLVGLANGRAARLALAERRRLLEAVARHTGWYARPDWRLNATEANAGAALLERHGWRAEACALGQGVALIEVRDLAVRGHPKRATLRALGEAASWLAAHGHGLRGSVAADRAAPPPPARQAGPTKKGTAR
jgi:hypothetical protein